MRAAPPSHAAARLDTGADLDPRHMACIDVGKYPVERIPVERDDAHWFHVSPPQDGARVDIVTMTRLNDAGLSIDDHLDHLTTRQWSMTDAVLSVVVANTDSLHWRYKTEPDEDPWDAQELHFDGTPENEGRIPPSVTQKEGNNDPARTTNRPRGDLRRGLQHGSGDRGDRDKDEHDPRSQRTTPAREHCSPHHQRDNQRRELQRTSSERGDRERVDTNSRSRRNSDHERRDVSNDLH